MRSYYFYEEKEYFIYSLENKLNDAYLYTGDGAIYPDLFYAKYYNRQL